MIKHSIKNSAASTVLASTPGSQFDELVGAIQPAHSGPDVPAADSVASNHMAPTADNVDHFAGLADFFAAQDSANGADHFVFEVANDSTNASSDNANEAVANDADDLANTSGDAIDLQHLTSSSTATSTSLPGVNLGLGADSHLGFDDHVNNDQLAGVLDHVDSLASSTNASNTSSSFSFNAPGISSGGAANVVSDALGHGGGGPGGGGGGGTIPSPYTTNSGTGVNIHVTFDSSVSNAPSGFVSTIEKVADFFASSLQDATAITINIAVGFGEVDGMKLGIGATGESVTNLQPVSYSDLANAYSATGLSLGNSAPNGNLYVSYAEAKALNVAITDPQAVDGWVGFSSKSGIFDYNNADGVSSKQYDFYGVVAHEFSEVLGRILLVGGNISGAASYSAYDFFHFSSPAVQDFSGNGGYFSIDQGTTNLASFNNPTFGGDPGDWASTGTGNSGGSAHDAFNAFDTAGVVTPVTHTDLVALQALGYTLNSHLV